MNDLVSVIVPIYNAEKYLRRCVDSILAQTYQNIEIILVDDGAIDDSGFISDAFGVQDERIKVIHKQNGGLSDARNTGVSIASGEYIVFCDSDDWMTPSIIENAVKESHKNSSDIVIWGYSADFTDDNEQLIKKREHLPVKIICQKGSDNSILSTHMMMSLMGYAWNKLYRSDVLNDHTFEKGVSLVEDILFNKKVITAANKIMFIDQIGTHYIQRERESLGTKFYPDFFKLKYKACQAREIILEAYGFTGERLKNVMSPNYFGVLKAAVRMTSRTDHFSSLKERRRYLRSVLSDQRAEEILEQYRPVSVKGRIVYWCIKLKAYRVLLCLFQKRKERKKERM